jgi:hypothetical protein
MSTAAEENVRAWVNARPIVGDGQPLARGAYLREQRSPADGAYVIVQRNPEGVNASGFAEDDSVSVARMQFQVFAGSEAAAESGAAALMSEIQTLTGCPEPCGEALVLVTDNRNGPFAVPGTAEAYCFQLGADFVLLAS